MIGKNTNLSLSEIQRRVLEKYAEKRGIDNANVPQVFGMIVADLPEFKEVSKMIKEN